MTPTATPTHTVLVVEDEPIVMRLIASLLTKQGYRVLKATTSSEATDLCKNAANLPIHVLLTDVMIPGMPGPQLAKHIATLCPQVRVLFMSGYTEEIIAEKGLLKENSPFIEKSNLMRSLAESVSSLLNLKTFKKM